MGVVPCHTAAQASVAVLRRSFSTPHNGHNYTCLHETTLLPLQAATCSSHSISRVVRPAAAGRRLVVRAAADNSVPAASSSQPPTLVWPQDNETAKDVFAFTGSLPEVGVIRQDSCGDRAGCAQACKMVYEKVAKRVDNKARLH